MIKMNKIILVSIIAILIIISGISGYLIALQKSHGTQIATVTTTSTVTQTITSQQVISPLVDPANLGNGEDYLINPAFFIFTVLESTLIFCDKAS